MLTALQNVIYRPAVVRLSRGAPTRLVLPTLSELLYKMPASKRQRPSSAMYWVERRAQLIACAKPIRPLRHLYGASFLVAQMPVRRQRGSELQH